MFQEKTINALRWIINLLNKKNITYQISGGFAAHLYGSKRPVNDIDIDIPEDKILDLKKDVEQYIIFGPKRINDGKWDMEIMTLNYGGQDIDIGGAYDARVSNIERTKWIPIPVDYSKIRQMKVEDMVVNVMSPEDVMNYKKHLDGEHQVQDIQAIQKYINSNVL